MICGRCCGGFKCGYASGGVWIGEEEAAAVALAVDISVPAVDNDLPIAVHTTSMSLFSLQV